MGDSIKNPALDPRIANMTAVEFISNLLRVLLGLAFIIGSLAFFFILILGGIEWITSGGDKVKVDDARRKVTNALIGLVLLFSVFAIANLVDFVFGVNITSFNLDFLNL
ncbi:hypothetical protein A3D84_00490 [Candidatus Woesebacteria bacterium RIFCSPHIGHO2_02_FULL_42_20]|uniref:DUF5671 domain-containing protein n=1 Tax=Candidatus Woesebacteria bacterium RIFCSPHIGHO2_12_FULL_41_24 TaxID=1802510 RepID=A0A1F8ATX4_9BACT|nr:MAG: hypothetical protein A2W15_01995 [Candidatus Woesebacteria bacterium RBG_16_41_13]OGM29729.1 MAG: hypothetical protein A2873_02415 [Candidatus Woesebacteria bacterium RIFCSPHIGHO2_01_FULL_42_80]OGM35256.1 MAG: hypothetical protein A3D84_00490 [Candidatus Woesebacteria bacterium RIFCSPHIGHO2_02_FULL_42_20]OGM55151.1 MAG: hypothetical protein A3E44_04500 [Candidatus Woesebacteria bacterium RIFCSPHIGHO2_12_FULL_41_24]OGM67723.1 MAG: hypothetical protein A2969_02205 [Candidatus Woesebacteri